MVGHAGDNMAGGNVSSASGHHTDSNTFKEEEDEDAEYEVESEDNGAVKEGTPKKRPRID